jgi:cation-transporting ATPase E
VVTDYLGLTEAAEPVFKAVLPALRLWFLVLTAVYRSRLLDRALGLDLLAEAGPPLP